MWILEEPLWLLMNASALRLPGVKLLDLYVLYFVLNVSSVYNEGLRIEQINLVLVKSSFKIEDLGHNSNV